jgi:hypothetical protein
MKKESDIVIEDEDDQPRNLKPEVLPAKRKAAARAEQAIK